MNPVETAIQKQYAKLNTLYIHHQTAQTLKLYQKDIFQMTQLFGREYKVIIIDEIEAQHAAFTKDCTPIYTNTPKEDLE